MDLRYSPFETTNQSGTSSGISVDIKILPMELFGFTSYQKYRYIIIPQVVRVLMPLMMINLYSSKT
jgi:polar amino acid transport system permease protein